MKNILYRPSPKQNSILPSSRLWRTSILAISARRLWLAPCTFVNHLILSNFRALYESSHVPRNIGTYPYLPLESLKHSICRTSSVVAKMKLIYLFVLFPAIILALPQHWDKIYDTIVQCPNPKKKCPCGEYIGFSFLASSEITDKPQSNFGQQISIS